MRKISCLLTLFVSISLFASERVAIWPKDKMPHRQEHQIAAMIDEAETNDFNADKNRIAYLEWYDAPSKEVRNEGCMILISGGGYDGCGDVGLF